MIRHGSGAPAACGADPGSGSGLVRAAMASARLLAGAAPLLLALAGCGGDVHFCSDLDPQPPNCEICTNGRDDDLDGDVDCDDSECRDTGACRARESAGSTSTTIADPSAEGASTTTTVP